MTKQPTDARRATGRALTPVPRAGIGASERWGLPGDEVPGETHSTSTAL